MEIVLAVATILGGITALWFFWDKVVSWPGRNNTSNISQHDIDLYEEYKSLFITNGVAKFYRQHDFLGAFQEDLWKPLSHYVDTWDTVEYEFVDKELDALHRKVYKSAYSLGTTIAGNTIPIGKDGHMRSVKPDNLPIGPTPEHILQEAQEINALTPEFYKCHEAFVKMASSKLYNKNV
ncbi:MAG: hypothetical protein KME37_09760 [Candidatus Thiodiazotropha sp. (ex Codakia orbicularis)]|nr:hypothetical protein [Candidatus Thiodiazotropha sp. (ex Codakia orbicularis)]